VPNVAVSSSSMSVSSSSASVVAALAHVTPHIGRYDGCSVHAQCGSMNNTRPSYSHHAQPKSCARPSMTSMTVSSLLGSTSALRCDGCTKHCPPAAFTRDAVHDVDLMPLAFSAFALRRLRANADRARTSHATALSPTLTCLSPATCHDPSAVTTDVPVSASGERVIAPFVSVSPTVNSPACPIAYDTPRSPRTSSGSARRLPLTIHIRHPGR
jgi:hypothetical protein